MGETWNSQAIDVGLLLNGSVEFLREQSRLSLSEMGGSQATSLEGRGGREGGREGRGRVKKGEKGGKGGGRGEREGWEREGEGVRGSEREEQKKREEGEREGRQWN